MTKTKIILIIAVLVIFGGVSSFIILNNSTIATTSNTQSLAQVNTSTASTTKSYTMTEVATHSSASSCWSAVNGKVYDLTSWINKHPGGAEAILSICGIDGSIAFNDQHGGQKRPANELAGFLIGNLK